MNLMAGHMCSITHRLNPKAHIDIKSDKLKVIKVVLRLSRHPAHALVFEVGFHHLQL